MKNILLLFTMATMLSCTNPQDNNLQLEIPASKQLVQGTSQIPADNPVSAMALDNTRYTWADLDNYYRTTLPSEKDKAYYKNLKNMAFSMLVNVFDLPEKAPKEVVAFYVEEQAQMPYTPFVNEFVICLIQLQGYWPEEKIQRCALDRYEKTKAYYLKNEIWRAKWTDEQTKYTPLLAVANK